MRTPPWRSFQKKFGPATDADATNFVRSTQALRPSFSGSCARPAASIIDGPGQRGGDCGSTSPRSLDELAQFLTHTAHYLFACDDCTFVDQIITRRLRSFFH